MERSQIINSISYYLRWLEDDSISKSLEKEKWLQEQIDSLYIALANYAK